MANEQVLRREAEEAGRRNVVPGQSWLEAFVRGLGREFDRADMGTPAGQQIREELGSLGYEQMLREQYPEEFARGRLYGSESFPTDIMSLAGPGASALLSGFRGMGPAGGAAPRPSLPPVSPLEGEVIPPRQGLPAPPPRALEYRYEPVGKPMTPPVNEWDANAVRATQIARGGPQRSGPFRPEDFGDYWRGPQGYFDRPTSMDDFIDLEARRVPNEFYDRQAQDQASALMREGKWREAFHPIYGPNANRPNYGEGPMGAGWADRPNPGIRGQRSVGMGGPAPYGEGAPGPGYWAGRPSPGFRPRVTDPATQEGGGGDGRGVPAVYGRGGMPNAGEMAGRGAPEGGGRYIGGGAAEGHSLPVLARSNGGLVPREIPGEFYEVRGLSEPSAGRYQMPPMEGGFVPPGGAPRGMNWGLPAAGAAGLLLGGGLREHPAEARLPPMPSLPLMAAIGDAVKMYQEQQATGGKGEVKGAVRPTGAKPQGGTKARPAARPAVRPTPLPPRRPDGQQAPGWEPNLNYLVTQAIDNLLGQREAERGREQQQYYEANPYQGF